MFNICLFQLIPRSQTSLCSILNPMIHPPNIFKGFLVLTKTNFEIVHYTNLYAVCKIQMDDPRLLNNGPET